LLSIILAHLASRQQINKSMKAIEIFRITLNFIGMYIDSPLQFQLILFSAPYHVWAPQLFCYESEPVYMEEL
jgi:hypothetical protein